MKKILYLLSSILCITAHAQYSVNTTISGLSGSGTNSVVTAGATSNYTASVQIARTRYVAIRVQFTTTNTGASGNLFSVWQTSLDNTNWSNALVITNTASGTNVVSAQTNQFDIGSLQYLRLRYITNSVSHQVTNLLATVTYKVSVAQDVISAIGYDVMPASTTLTNLSVNNGTALTTSFTNLVNVALTPSLFNGGTGASSSTYLRGDNTWATPSGGSGGTSLWELDSNGDLQPNTDTAAAIGWELDSNGDLQPST